MTEVRTMRNEEGEIFVGIEKSEVMIYFPLEELDSVIQQLQAIQNDSE